MSVWIGKENFSPIKGYGEIQGDMSVVNSTVYVTEGKILKIDSGYAFCMIAKGIDDLSKADSFKSDSPVVWVAHTKEYERWTKDNPKLLIQPTLLEQTIVQYLESDGSTWLEKSFNGKLHLNANERVLTGIKEKGMWDWLVDFQECEPNLIKDVAVGSNGKRGYSGQTEAQKLSEKQAFLINTAGPYGKGCEDLASLSLTLIEMKKDTPEGYEIFMQLISVVVKGG